MKDSFIIEACFPLLISDSCFAIKASVVPWKFPFPVKWSRWKFSAVFWFSSLSFRFLKAETWRMCARFREVINARRSISAGEPMYRRRSWGDYDLWSTFKFFFIFHWWKKGFANDRMFLNWSGHPALIENFPHHLGLIDLDWGGYICGASNISPRW